MTCNMKDRSSLESRQSSRSSEFREAAESNANLSMAMVEKELVLPRNGHRFLLQGIQAVRCAIQGVASVALTLMKLVMLGVVERIHVIMII